MFSMQLIVVLTACLLIGVGLVFMSIKQMSIPGMGILHRPGLIYLGLGTIVGGALILFLEFLFNVLLFILGTGIEGRPDTPTTRAEDQRLYFNFLVCDAIVICVTSLVLFLIAITNARPKCLIDYHDRRPPIQVQE